MLVRTCYRVRPRIGFAPVGDDKPRFAYCTPEKIEQPIKRGKALSPRHPLQVFVLYGISILDHERINTVNASRDKTIERNAQGVADNVAERVALNWLSPEADRHK